LCRRLGGFDAHHEIPVPPLCRGGETELTEVGAPEEDMTSINHPELAMVALQKDGRGQETPAFDGMKLGGGDSATLEVFEGFRLHDIARGSIADGINGYAPRRLVGQGIKDFATRGAVREEEAVEENVVPSVGNEFEHGLA